MRPEQALELIEPRWDAPANVHAHASTRRGGLSSGAFAGLNLGDHVGDDGARVAANRALLREALALPAEPFWLRQVHGCTVASAHTGGGAPPRADAAVAHRPGRVCAVMTADCLPLLFCDDGGRVVAAAHAGWRGLLDGILEATVVAMRVPPEQVQAWLGPAIGPDAYEVGPEVRERFCTRSASAAEAFVEHRDGHWLANLYLLARQRLSAIGVHRVSGGEDCTFTDGERFFSYRRDGCTGRMASLIWMEAAGARRVAARDRARSRSSRPVTR